MGVMIPIDHTSGYSLVSSISLNSIVRKINFIGPASFNISLLMESWLLALLSFNCFVPLESFSAVSSESNTGLTPLIMCLAGELSSWVFSEWKRLEECSTQLFGEIALRVSELTLLFSNFRCDQKRLGLCVNDSILLILSASHSCLQLLIICYLAMIQGSFGFFCKVAAKYFSCFF